MKKILFLILLGTLTSVGYAETKNENHEKGQKKIEKSVEAIIKNKKFILKADRMLTRFLNPNKSTERSKCTNSNSSDIRLQDEINFLIIDGDNATLQLSWNDDQNQNGMGGFTVNGKVSNYRHKGKDGKAQFVRFNILGAKLNVKVIISTTKNSNRAEAKIESYTNYLKATIGGKIEDLNSATYYKGREI